MKTITEEKFAVICRGIREDKELIVKHNPIGTTEEILLWMLLSCLISYLSLSDSETPCFTGMPDADTYRKAILYVLADRRENDFSVESFLDQLIN